MKGLNVREFDERFDFEIIGTSYAGAPKNGTVMFVTKKVQGLLSNLEGVRECLVFVEEGAEIPPAIKEQNVFVICRNPQLSYARFAERLLRIREEEESHYSFRITAEGAYISETAVIGENVRIGPGCVIGHGVVIGNNASIYSGCKIKHAVIGDDFVCNENAVIGSYSFTMATDENGNKYRIPALGLVRIGNGVEVGANNNIACGTCGDTVLEDFVKLDALIHIGHDCHLRQNVEITAGVTVSGFVDAGEKTYFGVGSVIRNRITIGSNAFIGMGAIVTKNVDSNVTVAGNPARLFVK